MNLWRKVRAVAAALVSREDDRRSHIAAILRGECDRCRAEFGRKPRDAGAS